MSKYENAYKNANELMNHIFGAKSEIAKEIKEYSDNHSLKRMLIGLRAAAGLTQADLAEKGGITQSNISKIERRENGAIRVSDLMLYGKVLEKDISIIFHSRALANKKPNLAHQAKYHADKLLACLTEIASLSKKDADMLQGALGLINELSSNVEETLAKELKRKAPKGDQTPVQVELQVENDCMVSA